MMRAIVVAMAFGLLAVPEPGWSQAKGAVKAGPSTTETRYFTAIDGLMDGNVPASNTLLVAQALIEADKDFDLIVFPEAGHGFANTPYMMRRRWNYFVQHLLGATPPAEFRFGQQRPTM